jgi:hypothetical protein
MPAERNSGGCESGRNAADKPALACGICFDVRVLDPDAAASMTCRWGNVSAKWSFGRFPALVPGTAFPARTIEMRGLLGAGLAQALRSIQTPYFLIAVPQFPQKRRPSRARSAIDRTGRHAI